MEREHRGAGEGGDRPRAAVPELRRAVAAPDQPARPLPLRVLPAPLRADLGLPQLRRALDDRADVLDGDPEVQQLRRLNAPSRYEHVWRRRSGVLGRSRAGARLARCVLAQLAPTRPYPRCPVEGLIEMSVSARAAGGRPGRALDPVGRLRAAARAGRGGAGGGRARDPRRRDGRALRAADHDRAAGRGGAARDRSRGGGDARRAPDDRAPRAPASASSCSAGADSITFHAEATPHVAYAANLIRESGACVGVAINPGDAGRRRWRGRGTCSTWRSA